MNNDLLQKIAQYDPTAAEDHQLIPPEKIEVHLKGKYSFSYFAINR